MALIDRQCTCRLLPHPARPSPLFRRVGIRNITFEALRLHTRCGPPDRSTAQGGLCHEASVRPVTRQSRPSATRSNRLLSGWHLPPMVFRAIGAHLRGLGHEGCKLIDRRSATQRLRGDRFGISDAADDQQHDRDPAAKERSQSGGAARRWPAFGNRRNGREGGRGEPESLRRDDRVQTWVRHGQSGGGGAANDARHGAGQCSDADRRVGRPLALRQSAPADGLSWAGAVRAFERDERQTGRSHQGRQQRRPPAADRGSLVLPLPAAGQPGVTASRRGSAASCCSDRRASPGRSARSRGRRSCGRAAAIASLPAPASRPMSSPLRSRVN